MFEIKVTIAAPEIVRAIEKLAEAFSITKKTVEVSENKQVLPKNEPKISEETPEKTAPKEKEVSKESSCSLLEVRDAFAKYSKTAGKDAAKAILLDFGVSKVTELEEKGLLDEAMNRLKEVK